MFMLDTSLYKVYKFYHGINCSRDHVQCNIIIALFGNRVVSLLQPSTTNVVFNIPVYKFVLPIDVRTGGEES